jgi:enoyl-CoA hydratase
MTESTHHILVARLSQSVALLTINCANENNRLTAELMNELSLQMNELNAEETIRALIITGAGEKYFATGEAAPENFTAFHQLASTIQNLGKPLMAAVNGLAAGIGADLALCCPLRMAVMDAAFESAVSSLTQAWHEAGRAGRARGNLDAFLRSQSLAAPEAFTLGLLNQMVEARDELLPACQALAEKFAANAPLAMQFALAAVNRGLRMSMDDALFLETTLFSLCFATADAREGTRAFLEKRPPQFKGR